MSYSRFINLNQALTKKSHFLFGPRATGKSWLIRAQLPHAQVFDLLNIDTFTRLLRRPQAMAEEINKDLVVIDEVQKLPQLLDEVHRLIEEKKLRFLLTGSSARKLKRGGANLLAGRARSLELYPLTRQEISDFDLLRYCNFGGLPLIYLSDDPWRDLKEYVHLYLKEEIISEAIVRKLEPYVRFLDAVGLRSGEELNFQLISSDSAVPVRTVANFYEILKDTLLAFELLPYHKTKKLKAVSKTKFYLFDVGVANYLAGRKEILTRSEAFGKAFEHFIIQEIRAAVGYHNLDLPMQYWRTVGGAHEVDCILGDEIAIEIKSSDRFDDRMLAGLKTLQQEKTVRQFMLVSRDPIERVVDGIKVIPYDQFLNQLWNHEIIK